jgi:hypothetical protein
MLDPFFLSCGPLRLVLWRTGMCYVPLIDVSDVFCATSPHAGSPTRGSQVPFSTKPSAEGTTVCLSSDSVQQDSVFFWYFGTIQTWEASTVYVNRGMYGEGKVEIADIRQYRSAKQCSSIQPGTESFFHSHPIPLCVCLCLCVCLYLCLCPEMPSAHIKGSFFHLQPCDSLPLFVFPFLSLPLFVSCLQCRHTHTHNTHALAPELEAELRRQLDAYQCRLGKHVQPGNMNVTSVEEALCGHFGTSAKGNWYREGLTAEHHFEQWATWQHDIADRLPELRTKWEQYNYCHSPSSTWTYGKYTLEDEWFNNKAKDLYPMHLWNVGAAAVSFCCLMVWFLLSPHREQSAKRLDQTCT